MPEGKKSNLPVVLFMCSLLAAAVIWAGSEIKGALDDLKIEEKVPINQESSELPSSDGEAVEEESSSPAKAD